MSHRSTLDLRAGFRTASRVGLLSVLLILSLSAVVAAEQVKVTVTTLVPEEGAFITPMWVGFHDGSFDVYDRGAAVSAGLESLVEDGATGPFSDEFGAAVADGVQSTLVGPDGPLFPGTTVSAIFDLDPSENSYFSYASMVIPSNDAFVANGNPLAHRVFDPNGNFTPVHFLIRGSEVLDAGTEVNDEAESSTAALGQAAPNTGTDENGVVEMHPGFLDGGRILAARPNGDFTAPGYRIAMVTIERAPRTRLTFSGSGDQEVPPVATDSSAACYAFLNEAQDELRVRCEHDVEGVAAAHVHEGAAGENGPVLFPFDDPASPIDQTFAVTSTDVDAFFAGGLYVNIHSNANPGGEVRAQVDGCFEGPGGLCLLGERFQVTSTFVSGGDSGVGQAVEATADAGQFTFFDAENVELDVKVLDGCDVNGNYWVFIAGLTDVGVTTTVTDTATGLSQTYGNAEGTPFELVRDIEAFSCN